MFCNVSDHNNFTADICISWIVWVIWKPPTSETRYPFKQMGTSIAYCSHVLILVEHPRLLKNQINFFETVWIFSRCICFGQGTDRPEWLFCRWYSIAEESLTTRHFSLVPTHGGLDNCIVAPFPGSYNRPRIKTYFSGCCAAFCRLLVKYLVVENVASQSSCY